MYFSVYYIFATVQHIEPSLSVTVHSVFLLHHSLFSGHLLTIHKGRSPYEAPEDTNDELIGPSQRTVSALHGDEYAQQYDERGHPVNQESKSLGRDLRRAKNDILSTMGIVVSSKDGKSGIASEKHNTDMIAAENDYGLIVATLDQALVFLGSWWTTSLIGRIQVSSVPIRRSILLAYSLLDFQALRSCSADEIHKC